MTQEETGRNRVETGINWKKQEKGKKQEKTGKRERNGKKQKETGKSEKKKKPQQETG